MPNTMNQTVDERVIDFVHDIVKHFRASKKSMVKRNVWEYYKLYVGALHEFVQGWEKTIVGENSLLATDLNQEEILQGFEGEELRIGVIIFARINHSIANHKIDKMKQESAVKDNPIYYWGVRPLIDVITVAGFIAPDFDMLKLAFQLFCTTEYQRQYHRTK